MDTNAEGHNSPAKKPAPAQPKKPDPAKAAQAKPDPAKADPAKKDAPQAKNLEIPAKKPVAKKPKADSAEKGVTADPAQDAPTTEYKPGEAAKTDPTKKDATKEGVTAEKPKPKKKTMGVWGIDLGQSALKAMRLELVDGEVRATSFDYVEHPKILSQPDADPDQLTREALEQFLSRNNLRGDMVVISVPGQSGLARFVKLPPVEEKKIADIVRFEAKQQIPFPLEEVVWDYQKLSSGSLSGDFVETEIGLFAMKREMVHRALSQFKDVGVEVHVIQMAPLALCNFIAYDQLSKKIGEGEEETAGKKQCVVALDMGTDSSNLVITDGAKIIWQRPIPIGGNHFTRALTKDLKLTFAKAEHLKRNAAKSPDLRKILASLKSVLNDFVGEVQRSLGYFTNTHRDAQIKYMVGLGNAFRLPGLKQFLQEKLQLEVHKLSKFERLVGEAVTAAPTFAENIMSFGVTYGLALQGLKQGRLHTNLLPHEVRVERMVRGKKPWAAAAAAALLIAVAGLAVFKGLENGQVTGADIERAKKEADNVLKQVSANNAAFKAEEDRIAKSKENLENLGAGTKDRLNWQYLHEYVNHCLPLATITGCERVTTTAEDGKDVKQTLLGKEGEAIRAFKLLEANRFPKLEEVADKVAAHRDEQFIKKHLIQVNIEGIMALYTEDLTPYFRKIHASGLLGGLYGMDVSEQKRIIKLAENKDADAREKAGLPAKGWVIEIRGYTYNKGTKGEEGLGMVRYTFVENLRNPEYIRNPAWLKAQPKAVQDQFAAIDEIIRKKLGYAFVLDSRRVYDPEPGRFGLIDKSQLRGLIAGDAGEKGGGGGLGVDAGGRGGGSGNVVAGSNAPGGGSTVPSGGDPKGESKGPSRDGWTPIGEIATAVLGAKGGGAATPGGVAAGSGSGGGGAYAGVKDLKNFGAGVGSGGKGASDIPAPSGGKGALEGPPGGEKKVETGPVLLQPRTEFIALLIWIDSPAAQGPAASAPAPGNTPTPGGPPTTSSAPPPGEKK